MDTPNGDTDTREKAQRLWGPARAENIPGESSGDGFLRRGHSDGLSAVSNQCPQVAVADGHKLLQTTEIYSLTVLGARSLK